MALKLTMVDLRIGQSCRCGVGMHGDGKNVPVFIEMDCDEDGSPLPTVENLERYRRAQEILSNRT